MIEVLLPCCILLGVWIPRAIAVAPSFAPKTLEIGAEQLYNTGSIDDDCTTGGFNLGTVTRFMPVSANTTGLTDNTLTAGLTYYLIVDGYAGGGNVDMLITGPCATAADCNDGIFCNGAELCTAGICAAGANPCIGSTPLCDEGTDTCSGCASNPGACVDDGLYCNGPGACLPSGACAQVGNPCLIHQTCDETTDVCVDPDPCISWQVRGNFFGGNISPQSFNACLDRGQFDDIQLSTHTSRELNSYQSTYSARDVDSSPFCTNGATPPICRPHAVGDDFTANMILWTVTSGGDCLPEAILPGTTCVRTKNDVGGQIEINTGFGGSITCNSVVGLMPGVILPDGDDDPVTGQCGVDFYLELFFNGGNAADGGSFLIDNSPSPGGNQSIGGPAMDDEFAHSVFVTPNCDTSTGMWDGTWEFGSFGPGFNSDFRRTSVCTEPAGPCCDGIGGCEVVTSDECTASGGTYLGDSTLTTPNTCASPDGDGDGSRDECDRCDNDPAKTAPGQCGCGNTDTDGDGDAIADCIDGCPNDPEKSNSGICDCGTSDIDSDSDGTADCHDGCPDDANKTAPGVCGCGVAETGDSDGDAVEDCAEQCPGVDDSTYAPGCISAIPAASGWGLVVSALALLSLGKIFFGRIDNVPTPSN